MHAWAFREKSLKFFSPAGWPKNIGIHFGLLSAGILLWGIYPVWYHGLSKSYDLLLVKEGIGWTWTIAVIALSSLAFFIGKRQAKLVDLSEAHFARKPTSSILLIYFLTRIIFLIAYEMWFRGWFLTELLAEFGTIWIAIGINTALYSFIHFFAGKKEAISSIPFGIILCLLTIELQVVWPAAVIHLFLSLGFELNFILRLNNDNISR
jgi:hypothetical protein